MTKHYFAYGSNLSRKQMSDRCPEHHYVCQGKLLGYRWIIYTRGYANIVPSEDDYVMGEIFQISESDERELDIKEGVSKGIYHKETLPIQTSEGEISCLVYIDSNQQEGVPRADYVPRINRGLVDAKLPSEYVQRFIRPFIPE